MSVGLLRGPDSEKGRTHAPENLRDACSEPLNITLVDVSDIFYFFLLGEGEGGRGAGRTEGAEGPGGCLRRIGKLGGGGQNIFFGAEMSTKITHFRKAQMSIEFLSANFGFPPPPLPKRAPIK